MAVPPDRPVISLFSGAMGLDLGLEQAGLRIAVAVECNKYAVATIRANRPDLPVIEKRIEDVTTAEILAVAGLRKGEAFAVVGGPSCQVFSTAGQRNSFGDPRGGMFHQFVRVVREAQPRFFAMENVRGLLSAAVRHRALADRGPGTPKLEEDEELGSAFRLVVKDLKRLRYATVFDLVNAADYGVPQTRQRLVFLGSRDGAPLAMPPPNHTENGPEGARWVPLRAALAGLDESAPEFYRFCPAKERFLAMVPSGGNWRDLPEELRAVALGRASDSWGGRSGFFRRLDWDEPSPALTTRPDSKATSLCHPTELRPLTVREYARIQGFPDDWQIEGPVRQKYVQVGNAVPVAMGAAIGSALLKGARRRKDPKRQGRVECGNLDLLVRLAKRPTVILNPPRMRSDGDATMAEWMKGKNKFRNADVIALAAPSIAARLREEMAKPPRKRSSARPERDATQVVLPLAAE